MKIVSLDPVITELLIKFGLGPALVGVSSACLLPDEIESPSIVARADGNAKSNLIQISDFEVNFEILKSLEPDLVLSMLYSRESDQEACRSLQNELRQEFGSELLFQAFAPRTLDQVYEFFELLGKRSGAAQQGRDLAQRLRAQIMNWCDNFYSRMKNKKVTFLSGIDPLRVAGLWIPDMIKLCSAVPQYAGGPEFEREISWQELMEFRPDVLIVAPRESNTSESCRLFTQFEKYPGWEDLTAVKRGDVFFTGGMNLFYRPSGALFESMGILVSAISSFDSGYITERDSFFRLRYLEMQRHKL